MSTGEESKKTKIRWYNPVSWVIGGAEGLFDGGVKVAKDAVYAVTAFPKGVIHGVKETKVRMDSASAYERTVSGWTTGIWFVIITACLTLLYLASNWFTGLIVTVVSGAYFFRYKQDLVRAQVVALLRMPEEHSINPLTFEIAAIRLEEVEQIIRGWKTLSKADRVGNAATIYSNVLSILSRDLPEGGDLQELSSDSSEVEEADSSADKTKGEGLVGAGAEQGNVEHNTREGSE